MKKFKYLFFLFTILTFGQSKEYSIKTEKNSKISSYYSFEDETFMVCTSLQSLSLKKNNPNVIRLDKNLQEIYNINFTGFTNFFDFSEDGAMLNNYKGNPKMTVIKEAFKYIDKKGEVNEIDKEAISGGEDIRNNGVQFLINDVQYTIGVKEKGKIASKSVYSIDDFYLYKLDLKIGESKTEKMNFRKFSGFDGEQKFRFDLLKTDSKSFTIKFRKFSRDVKEKKYEQFLLLTYDLDGNEIKETIIGIPLEDDKNIAFYNVMYDKLENVYYNYGFYHEHKNPNRKLLITKYKGYYIQKYDIDGKLLWKTQAQFSSDIFDDAQSFQDCVITLNKVNSNDLLFSYGNTDIDILNEVIIDKNTGKTKYEKVLKFKLSYQNYKKYPKGVEHRFIKDIYGKNNFFSIEALQLLSINDEFSNYAKQFKDTKNDTHFKSFILEDGFLILQIDNENSDFKILKFDW